MKKPWTERFGDFMAGKGFYIVLFLCVAAIGISGYYLFSSLDGADPAAPVAGTAQVTVTPGMTPGATPTQPAVEPVKPTVPARPAPTPSASPAVSPAPSAAAASTPAVPEPTRPVATVYTWPVKGTVLKAYSPDKQVLSVTMGDWRTHDGMDIAADLGLQVKAAGNGTVESVEQDYFMGTTVTIDHGNGVRSIYSNLAAEPTVKAGDTVSVGDIIGSVGRTAKSESKESDHLHFAMTSAGLPVDPLDYLPEQK